MSYMKPDYDYDPLEGMYGQPQNAEASPSKIIANKNNLVSAIKTFQTEVVDAEIHRFCGTTALSFKTSVNVFDSVSFFKKFSDAYLFSVKKNFPEMKDTTFIELTEMFENLEKYLAENLKSSNVENKYLLALSLGMLEGMLNYENY